MPSVGRCGVVRLQMKFGHVDGMHCIIYGSPILVKIKSVALYNCRTVYVSVFIYHCIYISLYSYITVFIYLCIHISLYLCITVFIYMSLYLYIQCLLHVPQKLTLQSSALYASLKAPKINSALLLYSTSVVFCNLNTVILCEVKIYFSTEFISQSVNVMPTTLLTVRHFRVPPRSGWDMRSSGLLRSQQWQFFTDVSGQPIGTIGNQNRVKNLEDGTDRLSRNVGKELPLHVV